MPPGQQTLQFERANGSLSSSRASSPLSSIYTEDFEELLSSEIPSRVATPDFTASKSSSKKRPRTSWIFFHQPDNDYDKEYINQITSKPEWSCGYCPKIYATSGSTSAPARYLIDCHSIPTCSARVAQAQNTQLTIQKAQELAKEQNTKRRKRSQDDNGSSIDGGILEILYVNFLLFALYPSD